MMNISGLLLLTFVVFFDFTSANGFPEVPAGHIVVEMEDGSYFKGFLQEDKADKIPYWLKPRPVLPKFYNVFMLKKSNACFSSKLQFIPPVVNTSLPINHNPHIVDHTPQYAEIRSGSDHLEARNFHLHERLIKRENKRSVGVYPSRNYVYILLPNKKIYTSVLEPYQADYTENCEAYATSGHTRMEPLTALAASCNQNISELPHTDHRENRGEYPTLGQSRMEPLTALATSGSQKSASVFPEVPAEHLVLEMEDGSHFEGLLKEDEADKFPYWLKPRLAVPKYYNAFILRESGAGFSSRLQFIPSVLSTSLPINQNQHNLAYSPKYAEIRLGSDHLTVRNFHLYERIMKKRKGRNASVDPSRNYVYISLPNGNVYTSVLEPHQADHRENRGGYAIPGLTRMEPLTALAVSDRRRSRSNSPHK